MPLVNIKVIEGVFNEEQKQEMIQKVTDTMVSIEGEKMRRSTWVEEVTVMAEFQHLRKLAFHSILINIFILAILPFWRVVYAR